MTIPARPLLLAAHQPTVSPTLFREKLQIDQRFLQTREGRLIDHTIQWLAYAEYGTTTKAGEVFANCNRILAQGTCFGEGQAFLGTLTKSRKNQPTLQQLRADAIFFQLNWTLLSHLRMLHKQLEIKIHAIQEVILQNQCRFNEQRLLIAVVTASSSPYTPQASMQARKALGSLWHATRAQEQLCNDHYATQQSLIACQTYLIGMYRAKYRKMALQSLHAQKYPRDHCTSQEVIHAASNGLRALFQIQGIVSCHLIWSLWWNPQSGHAITIHKESLSIYDSQIGKMTFRSQEYLLQYISGYLTRVPMHSVYLLPISTKAVTPPQRT